MEETQEVLKWSAMLAELLPVLVGGLIAVFAAAVTGLVTSRIQDRRIRYQESVRIDQVRRDLLSRFDHVRREIYGKFSGAVRRLSTESTEVISSAVLQPSEPFRTHFLRTYMEVAELHAEVAMVGTYAVATHADELMAIVTDLYFGTLKLSGGWSDPTGEKLPVDFQEWGRRIDAAQREFIRAVRSELRIIELQRDPVLGVDDGQGQGLVCPGS